MDHKPHSWTASTLVEWGKRCDQCKRWRVRARYLEMYDDHGWWRECLNCAVDDLGDLAREGMEVEKL